MGAVALLGFCIGAPLKAIAWSLDKKSKVLSKTHKDFEMILRTEQKIEMLNKMLETDIKARERESVVQFFIKDKENAKQEYKELASPWGKRYRKMEPWELNREIQIEKRNFLDEDKKKEINAQIRSLEKDLEQHNNKLDKHVKQLHTLGLSVITEKHLDTQNT